MSESSFNGSWWTGPGNPPRMMAKFINTLCSAVVGKYGAHPLRVQIAKRSRSTMIGKRITGENTLTSSTVHSSRHSPYWMKFSVGSAAPDAGLLRRPPNNGVRFPP